MTGTAGAAPPRNPATGESRAARWRLPLAMVVVLAAAALLRWWRLGAIPPGLQFDEAHNALDAIRVLGGRLAVFFPENGGREPLLTYLQAPALAALGADNAAYALRFTSSVIGILTVAIAYRGLSTILGARTLGLLAAAYLATSYWHVHFSRYAIRAILAPLWATAALWAWWLAVDVEPPARDGHPTVTPRTPPLRSRGSRRSWLWALLAGLLLAAAVYSHPSGRLLPLVLVAHAGYRTFVRRDQRAATWRALAITGATALVLFLPLAAFFARHTWLFTSHPSDVSLAAVADARYGGSLVRATAGQIVAVAGMLFVAGDPSLLHNLPHLPVFDPLSALLAVIGIGVLLGAASRRACRRDDDAGRHDGHVGQRAASTTGSDEGAGRDAERAVLVLAWLLVMILPTVLSDRPPNYSRAIAALPAIVALPALGLAWLQRRLPRLRGQRAANTAAVAALAFAFLWTAYQYFVAFGTRTPETYASYDVPKRDAYRALARAAQGAAVFLMPVWAEHATFAYLNRNGPVGALDASDAWVLPGGAERVVTAFPVGEDDLADWLKEANRVYGHAGRRYELADGRGEPVVTLLDVPATAVGDLAPPTDAPLEPRVWSRETFGEAIELVGYSYGETAPGEIAPIVLVWRVRQPIDRDLTMFVHLTGADGRPAGQADEAPATGSYPTTRWRPGDVIIDRVTPRIAADAQGPIGVRIGWYDASDGTRLETTAGTDLQLEPIALVP